MQASIKKNRLKVIEWKIMAKVKKFVVILLF